MASLTFSRDVRIKNMRNTTLQEHRMHLAPCVILGITLALAGCATERWVQPGKTDAEAEEAFRQCVDEVAPKPRAFSEPMYKLPLLAYKKCMESKEYTLVKETR